MFFKNIVNRCVSVGTGFVIAIGSNIPTAFAQSASDVSLYQAWYNAGLRLEREGFLLNTLEGAPYDTFFAESGEVSTMRMQIPRTGHYILLIGGDNDTVDLNVYFPQANARDVTFGRTAFINFDVSRPGEFLYTIDMANCRTINCGVAAVLLRTR